MERLMKILNDANYIKYLDTIEKNEKNRIFCRHGLQHFTDVARISYLINLEENLGFSKEIIYAASFLHDIGRAVNNENHDEESWNIAKIILPKYGFSDNETELIGEAILNHRSKTDLSFGNLIHRADKLSRQCYNCKARSECYWEKKNDDVRY